MDWAGNPFLIFGNFNSLWLSILFRWFFNLHKLKSLFRTIEKLIFCRVPQTRWLKEFDVQLNSLHKNWREKNLCLCHFTVMCLCSTESEVRKKSTESLQSTNIVGLLFKLILPLAIDFFLSVHPNHTFVPIGLEIHVNLNWKWLQLQIETALYSNRRPNTEKSTQSYNSNG